MNKSLLTALALSFVLASCGTSQKNTNRSTTDSALTAHADTVLTGQLALPLTLKADAPIEMKFTVHNYTDTARTFCKWHTPFERLMSKYLDIVAENGEGVAYTGPMAKRVMPPPADSYILIKPNDSLTVTVDLRQAYDFKNPGKYTIKYNSENISCIHIPDSLSLTLTK